MQKVNKLVTEKGQKREQSIELLRIVLMTLIVFGHFIGFGYHSKTNPDGTLNLSAYLSPLYLYHVDAFVFISGYFGINLKWRKFILLIVKMVIYSLFAIGLASLLMPDFRITISSLLNNMYPFSACDWWFMAQYLFLMLLSPFINAGMEKLDRKQATILIIVLYLSWFRCTSVLLLFIYILGRYLRKYPCTFIENNAGKIFVTSVAVFFALNYYLMNEGIYIQKIYDYMSPFNVISAVAIFYVFKRWHITWGSIGKIASGVLAAYLITTHELPRQAFNDYFFELEQGSAIALLLTSLIVVVACSGIDNIVTKLLNSTIKIHDK